jgi:formamidopyrimidine-DNA glycosylase
LPELPEIDHLRRTLEPVLLGSVVRRVKLTRPDIVRCSRSRSRRPEPRVRPSSLLMGEKIERLQRHGKELAIVSRGGASVCVHLGMSGQLWHCPPGERLRCRDHVHCVWHLGNEAGNRGRLVFRDPRRFGGLWCYASLADLTEVRWSRLGPDALRIDTRSLRKLLAGTRRSIKATLLDQGVLAGIGNIYADEILFAAGIHPQSVASGLPPDRCRRLAGEIRRVLATAVRNGGSTIRDYVDGNGAVGSYAMRHRVYGRAGEPCTVCGQSLCGVTLAQRATVLCDRCQELPL